ncbi:hypothetical protein AAMO2058_000890000 [Amorphochlora amoebiformis]
MAPGSFWVALSIVLSEANPWVPSSGFTVGTLGHERLAVHVRKRIDRPVICTEITLQFPSAAHFLDYQGEYSLHSEMYNNKPSWKNKKQRYISFLANQGEGTWIVGDSPGEDAGIAYVRIEDPTLIPPETGFMLLRSGGWVSAPEITAKCTGTVAGHMFYMVQFATGFTTLMVPPVFETENSQECEKEIFERRLDIDITILHPYWCETSFFNHGTEEWEIFKIETEREPLWIGGGIGMGDDEVFIITSAEHIHDQGWRLTTLSPTTNTYLYPMLTKYGELTLPEQFNEAYKQNNPKSEPVSLALEITQNSPDINGRRALSSLLPGQWAWVFLDNGRDLSVVEPRGVCLQLLAEKNGKLVFRWHSTDRHGVLFRSRIDNTVSIAVADINDGKKGSVELQLFGRDQEKGLGSAMILSLLPMNTTPFDYVEEYLRSREGMNGLSSCFFYHSAVALPEPLIYMAELLCVLRGSKPIAMVQFTSPSDEETKYPFIEELCTHIAATRVLMGDEFPVNWKIFKYSTPDTGEKHETLIVYRTEREELLDAFLPGGRVAQALHILPFPRTDHLQDDQRAQIYNSYWNGVVLGYPESMINIYIRDFKNDLPQEIRIEESTRARKDVETYFQANRMEATRIEEGLLVPVNRSFYASLPTVMAIRGAGGGGSVC